MTITITAFEHSPDGGKGLARDTRVRWALEEVGQPYEVFPVSFAQLKEPAHLARNPFGQIPTFREGDLVLFESGAIIHHLGTRYGKLLPENADARARALMWMFAAVNSVEPSILDMSIAKIVEGKEPWAKDRMPLVLERLRKPMNQLSARLGESEWLEGEFTAGDLMMISVILRLKPSGVLNEWANLAAYVARGEARPAYQRAYAAQAAFNAKSAP
ncbi:MAG TPA: glutathione S-transferase family protein, partial [Polyangiaceae bacterium]